MPSKYVAKLSVCTVLFFVLGCASSAPRNTTELERKNKELERRIQEEKAEVSRLQKFLNEEASHEIELSEGEDLAKVPLTILKPEVEKKEEENSEDEEFSQRRAIAVSKFESMTWYQQGIERMKSGRYDSAIQAFTTFLRQTPEHVYADRAQYQIGECYYRNREYGLAVIAFNLVVSQYPHSIKVPEAMYGAALSHLEMGHRSPAQGLLRDLLRQFPADAITGSASKKLAEISKPNRG